MDSFTQFDREFLRSLRVQPPRPARAATATASVAKQLDGIYGGLPRVRELTPRELAQVELWKYRRARRQRRMLRAATITVLFGIVAAVLLLRYWL